MKRTAMQHTKLKRLVRALGVPQYAAVGILESLWHLTAREALLGNIGKLSNEDIALSIDWDGDPEILVAGLVATGWLDEDDKERLLVHDWFEHADDTTKKAISRQIQTVAENGGNVQTKPDKVPLPLPLPKPLPEPKKQRQPQAAFVLPEWIFKDAWEQFEEMRRKNRCALTLDGRNLCVKKLESLKRAGHDPTAVLNQSVMNGWRGLFEVKGESVGANQRRFEPGVRPPGEDDEMPADVVAELRAKIAARREAQHLG